MKDVINTREVFKKLKTADIIKEIGIHIIFMLFSFTVARGRVMGGILPFGAAFLAATPPEYLAMSAIGCFFGYLFPSFDINAFRYMAALFAIVAVKALLSALTKYYFKPIVSALTAGVITAATGLTASVGDDKQTVLCFAEAMLSFTGGYFLSTVFSSYPSLLKGVKGQDLACLLISVNMVLVGTMSITPGGISVGKILSITFVLLVSRFGGSYAGAVGGIAASLAVALSGTDDGTAIALCLAGLIGGIFAPFGRYVQFAAVIGACLLGSAFGRNLTATVELFIESLFASAIYLVIPRNVCIFAGKIFSPPTKTISENGMKKAVTMRLRFAAGALSDVGETVETVSKELSRINSPDFDGVLRGIEKDACAGCSLCVGCWEGKRADTVSAVLEIIKGVREGEAEPEKSAPEEFRGRCLRPSKIGEATLRHYSDYASRMAAESRISDVRSVVSEQFGGISSMLSSMAAEFERDEAFDERGAAKITAALKNIEISPRECVCLLDKFGRMTVEIICDKTRGVKFSRMKLLRQVEVCVDREFEPPSFTENGDKLYITLSEKARLSVDTGVCQIASSPSGICGDAYNVFSDGKGRCFVVLSDGMGSGGRAAVDGAMASGLMMRLIKAGFGYDSSLSILNSAMLYKSTDESLATVDVAALDLFSGRLDMLKAGAAPTLVRRAGRCCVAQSTSLPAGILREIGFDKAAIKLKKGDIILMMSDGVCSEGTDWISKELEGFNDITAQSIAERIAYGAKRRRTDNHSDDITVIATIINKAV